MRKAPRLHVAGGGDQARGHVVADADGLGLHRVEHVLGGGVAAGVADDLRQPGAAEDAVLGGGLGQAVGVEAGDGARGQRHGGLAQPGRQAPADRRRPGGEHRLVARATGDDRRRVAGARVGERPVRGVVHRHDHRGEVAVELAAHGALGDLEGEPRLQPGLEVGAQRVAHEGGVGERGAAVAGHVAEDERGAPAGERERVVEVAARPGAVRRPVRHRCPHGADLLRHRRQQRGLEQADLLHQLAALAAEPARANRGEQVAAAEEDGQRGEQGQRRLERLGHDLHHLAHGARDPGVVLLRSPERMRRPCRLWAPSSPRLDEGAGASAAASAGPRSGRAAVSAVAPAPAPAPVRPGRARRRAGRRRCSSAGSRRGSSAGAGRLRVASRGGGRLRRGRGRPGGAGFTGSAGGRRAGLALRQLGGPRTPPLPLPCCPDRPARLRRPCRVPGGLGDGRLGAATG